MVKLTGGITKDPLQGSKRPSYVSETGHTSGRVEGSHEHLPLIRTHPVEHLTSVTSHDLSTVDLESLYRVQDPDTLRFVGSLKGNMIKGLFPSQ